LLAITPGIIGLGKLIVEDLHWVKESIELRASEGSYIGVYQSNTRGTQGYSDAKGHKNVSAFSTLAQINAG
jgi:hypothetical protein